MLNLNFSTVIPNTISDKDGQGTGFNSVQPNANGDQYQPSRIDINPTAGTLTIVATNGTSAGATNTLKNALQRGINDTKPFTISTRLQGPATRLTSAFQQGGIYFGSDQNNFVKLVLVNTGGTNGLRIQFYKEENGVGSSVGEIAGLNWGNINTLDLYLTGDPATKRFTAAYRVNSNTAPSIVLNQSFRTSQGTPFFIDASNTRAGVMASTTNAPQVAVTFDNFGIAQDIKINFQPNAAPLPAGYVKDSGLGFNAVRGFGWVRSGTSTPLNIASFARDRNRTGIAQRLDTLQHMQFFNNPAAAWEIAVPNGSYIVAVSVGDGPNQNGVYDSRHTIRVEGITAIDRFQSTPLQEYKLETVRVNVTDGRLTLDAVGGTNTKINFLEIFNITPGRHPNVTGIAVDIIPETSRAYLNTSINVDVALARAGAGVDAATLNTSTVQLYRTRDGQIVPGTIGTSGGNDVIVYQPSQNLEPNTNYTFIVTNGVRDESGTSFNPQSFTFNTGDSISTPSDPRVNFTKSTVYNGAPLASLTVGPDGRLYAAGLDGKIRRWNINAGSGTLSNLQIFEPTSLNGRAIIGLAFDPNNPNNLWIAHNNPLFPQPATDFTSKVSKIVLNQNTSAFNAVVQDYVVGLPRSAKDHLSNSLAFGADGQLYLTQGSNTAMGAPDTAWANRPERLLSAAVLQIDPSRNAPTGGFNVQTEAYNGRSGNYNPFATNAPVKLYATGVRNAYDLVWHTNGNLYVPTNGSGANGNTPDDPRTAANEALQRVATQNDYLFRVVEGGYYGHPNPRRGEYILNGGNPTNGVDPAEIVRTVDPTTGVVYAGYPVGTQPDSNYRGFAYDFGRNRSANGIIEYKSNTFGGALRNKLLVVEYSGGDDILALDPGVNGNIPRGNVTKVISGLNDPLDLIEDTRKNFGNLYVAELINNGAAGQISLLRVS